MSTIQRAPVHKRCFVPDVSDWEKGDGATSYVRAELELCAPLLNDPALMSGLGRSGMSAGAFDYACLVIPASP